MTFIGTQFSIGQPVGTCDSPTFNDLSVTGTINTGLYGKITSQVLSVGTTWVNIPLILQRRAFFILASSLNNGQSCLAAVATDDSNYDVGNINILTVSNDYPTGSTRLELQWPINTNLQTRMNGCATRDVSVLVIRA